MAKVDNDKIEKILTRGVENIYPSADYLRQRLLSGERLTIYLGVDPTGPSIHIGHFVSLLKLRAFQDLGHHVILLIGDFTATIGDPTDKTATRAALSHEEVLKNSKQYKEQASRIIDFCGDNPAFIKYNSSWLARMSFEDVLNLASKMTYAQTIKRDMFQKRIKEDKDLYLHEFLYPLMQGYDSVAMDVDGEIGGNDQTFNMLVGRDLMKKMKNREKFVMTMKLLTDPLGKKMGKSEGNMVALSDSPEEIYGKIMSWNDDMIFPGLELCTTVSADVIDSVRNKINSGENPKEAKMFLAREIIKVCYDSKSATVAEQNFVKTFSEGGIPKDILEVKVESGERLKELLIKTKMIESSTEFKRLISENAINFEKEKISDPFYKIKSSGVLKIGKKRFLRVIVE